MKTLILGLLLLTGCNQDEINERVQDLIQSCDELAERVGGKSKISVENHSCTIVYKNADYGIGTLEQVEGAIAGARTLQLIQTYEKRQKCEIACISDNPNLSQQDAEVRCLFQCLNRHGIKL